MKPSQRRILVAALLTAFLLGDLGLYLWSSRTLSANPPTEATVGPSVDPSGNRQSVRDRSCRQYGGGRFGDVPMKELVESRDTYFAAMRMLLDYKASDDRSLLLQATKALRELDRHTMNVYVRSGLPFNAWCRERLGDTSYRDKLISQGLFNDTQYRFFFSKGFPDGAVRYQMRLECGDGLEEVQQALGAYRAAHGGGLPPRLEDLETASPMSLMHCPSSTDYSYELTPNGVFRCRNHLQRGTSDEEDEQSYKVHLMLLDGYTETERLNLVWDDLVKVSGLHEGQTIADVGCGPGLFTFPLAEKVGPRGKVYAVDINRSVLDFVAFAASEKPNLKIDTFLASKSELTLPPESVELITVIETYHSMIRIVDPDEAKNLQTFLLPWLRTVRRALKPGGLLVVGDGNVDSRVVRDQVPQAGFELVPTPAPGVTLRDEDYFSVFRRPLEKP